MSYNKLSLYKISFVCHVTYISIEVKWLNNEQQWKLKVKICFTICHKLALNFTSRYKNILYALKLIINNCFHTLATAMERRLIFLKLHLLTFELIVKNCFIVCKYEKEILQCFISFVAVYKKHLCWKVEGGKKKL